MTHLIVRHPLTPTQLLDRVLESPQLITAIRKLEGPILGKLIHSVGLEDAAELVALASTAQLESIFDEDLWHLDGRKWEERFDPRRFALWLHAFAEAGEEALVKRLVELPLDFVILAVHRLILVIDTDRLAIAMLSQRSEDLDMFEKALGSSLFEEWEEFRLIARDDSVWEDLMTALFALDRDHHGLLRQILECCAEISLEWIEENGGLYEVLSSDEMLECDQRAERDDRRAEKGYVSPADACAFLALAKQDHTDPTKRDAISKAYFRALSRPWANSKAKQALDTRTPETRDLMQLLEQAAVILPTASHSGHRLQADLPQIAKEKRASDPITPRILDSALASLRQTDLEAYDTRVEELGYLTNVLMAIPGPDGQRPRLIEAVEKALTVANHGLERVLHNTSENNVVQLLRTMTMDSLFRRGYC